MTQKILEISDSAQQYLQNMLDKSQRKYVTLSVRGGGCSGFKYEWDFADDNSLGTVIDDILVLDAMAEMFVFGCTVDYVEELGGNYLVVKNPNARAQCGCGESFNV